MRESDSITDERAEILGVGISAIDVQKAVSTIDGWVQKHTCNYVCVTGVHGVIESQDDPTLKRIHNQAGMVTPDGMPLVWVARRLGYSQIKRVYGPDLMRAVTALAARRRYRQFYYGGAPGLAEQLRDALVKQHPELQVCGTLSPPFRPLTQEEDEEIISKINAAKPDILWVGLSTPKQEKWMEAHLGRIDVPVMIGVGAAFDFLAGTKRQAPSWMQRSGLEWLFRLVTEPKRLWRRYAHIVPRFIALAAMQLLFSKSAKRARQAHMPSPAAD
jgi:N-acetylglucosaminyldiphosphoundecaprenol N-acetyl-beta-D-mannosaminyltransferase